MRRATTVLLTVLALTTTLVGCGGNDGPDPTAGSGPSLSAEIVQLRRDQVLERVEVSVHNTSGAPVTVEQLRVDIPGFGRVPAIPKGSPIADGLTVNLPWTYGPVRCTPDAAPRVGKAVVHLRVRTEGRQEPMDLRVPGRDPDGLLQRIADRTCTVERVRREVSLSLDDEWRVRHRDGRKELLGTLTARLLGDQPRDVTQTAGAIMYGLEPDTAKGPPPAPLAHLTPERPEARVPVVAYAARCDGHTKGEIKKPYEFLVWVGPPGDDEPVAVTPDVGEATKLALRQVCAF